MINLALNLYYWTVTDRWDISASYMCIIIVDQTPSNFVDNMASARF